MIYDSFSPAEDLVHEAVDETVQGGVVQQRLPCTDPPKTFDKMLGAFFSSAKNDYLLRLIEK